MLMETDVAAGEFQKQARREKEGWALNIRRQGKGAEQLSWGWLSLWAPKGGTSPVTRGADGPGQHRASFPSHP